MKYGLAVFPALYDSFYGEDRRLLYTQRLEPSVLYVAPRSGDCVFLADNRPRPDVDVYLCSVYTRGWREFTAFAAQVGRGRVVAGGYHPTAMPQETLAYAHKVVTATAATSTRSWRPRAGASSPAPSASRPCTAT